VKHLLAPAASLLFVIAALALSACSRSQSTAAAQTAAPAVATLNLTYAKPSVVGTPVRATAQGLSAGRTVELMWGTVTGGWVVEDYYHFRGKKYSESRTELGRFAVDPSGRFDANFTIPEDYGGVHEVIAVIDGKPVAQNGINVTQSFEIAPSS